MKPTISLAEVEVTNPNFRPGTKTVMKEVVFNFIAAGRKSAAMGDMIAWLPAIVHVAESYNYVAGHLIVPPWFIELAANVMRKYPHWRVHTAIPDRIANGTALRQPMDVPINATGMHLVDLGFLYFVGIVPPPEGTREYPELELDDVEAPPGIPVTYAVLTPGTITETRKILPATFNAICDHLVEEGVTPVFLGTDTMDKGKRQIEIDSRYDFSKGINLINKTTLLQAAKIMKHSTMVIGIDNGLLHLAGMTDATILYGYTMTGPEQRRIPRPFGHTVELYGDKKILPCLFCQERVRFFADHHFTNCIYKEYEPACVKALNKETWIANIDAVLKGPK